MDGGRILLVLRHAQAGGTRGTADEQRPLTAAGQSDATAVGRWLLAGGLIPDRVLCSTARRTRQTWQQVSAALAAAGQPGARQPGIRQPGTRPAGTRQHGAGQPGEGCPGAGPPGAGQPQVSFDPRLYNAGADTLLAVTRECPAEARVLLLVCHNPAAQQCASALTGRADLAFPAGALAVIRIGGGWLEAGPGAGELVKSWRPPGPS